jgi:hypothetical protein
MGFKNIILIMLVKKDFAIYIYINYYLVTSKLIFF